MPKWIQIVIYPAPGNPETITFPEWLRQRRRLLDLTQQALADQVGCARITLRRIESGALKPSRQLALILVEKLGIPAAEREAWGQFARNLSDFPGKTGPALTPPQRSTNLPAAQSSFIGRTKEQVKVTSLIVRHRLVTLTGPGGVGKTRLSIKVGEQVLSEYGDGVWLVELAALNEPALLPQTVMALFGIVAQSNISHIEALTNFLRTKTALLILDNCEHLIDACARLADTLLQNCPNLKILATSREPLGITGEAIYPVPPLGLPDLAQLLENFREYETVRLFEERAQLASTDFSLTLENASPVAQICHRLDGIPLAIELAAGHVSMFSPEQIATRLNESFNLLTGGSRTALPRQRTIRASIEWSWKLLSDSERILLRRLAVFAGGWILESAETVCNADVTGAYQVSETMSQLVAKSLVAVRQARPEFDRRELHREPRYHLLETIREFALEQLREANEESGIRDNHLDFFMKLAEDAEPKLKTSEQLAWLDRLETERGNLRAALGWALMAGKVDQQARLASALARFWVIRGPMMEGQQWLDAILAHNETLSSGVRAKTYWAAGYLAFSQGRYTAAQPLLEYGLYLAREINDQRLIAESLRILSGTIRNLGDPVTARAYVSESLSIFQELSERWGIGWSLCYLALAISSEGDGSTAFRLLKESLKLFRQLGENRSIAWSLIELADIAYAQQDYVQAEVFSRESLALFDELGDHRGVDRTLRLQGNAARGLQQLELASSLFVQSLNLNYEQGDQEGIALCLLEMAELAGVQANFVRAGHLIGWVDAMREQIADPRWPVEQAVVDREIAGIITNIGALAFQAVYDRGKSMTLDEVVACALDDP